MTILTPVVANAKSITPGRKAIPQGLKSVCENPELWEPSGAHFRSLGSPGFPVDLVGVDGLHAVFLLRKTAHAAVSSAAWQEIRVRSG